MAIPLRRHKTLRDIYETEMGEPISDRTWRRIKSPQRLCCNDEDMNLADVVRMAARLQKQCPRKRITRLMALKALRIQRDFPTDVTCNGKQLHESVCRVLGYEVPRQTMYRWGKELRCRFSMRRWYTPEQVKLWASKVIPNEVNHHG